VEPLAGYVIEEGPDAFVARRVSPSNTRAAYAVVSFVLVAFSLLPFLARPAVFCMFFPGVVLWVLSLMLAGEGPPFSSVSTRIEARAPRADGYRTQTSRTLAIDGREIPRDDVIELRSFEIHGARGYRSHALYLVCRDQAFLVTTSQNARDLASLADTLASALDVPFEATAEDATEGASLAPIWGAIAGVAGLVALLVVPATDAKDDLSTAELAAACAVGFIALDRATAWLVRLASRRSERERAARMFPSMSRGGTSGALQ
jgi:hypothetical protein